ncbi:lysophospholipid acyltransferase family protein [Dichotomicrobium thermohalophilum]|uniref:1-acyl-sn-glycerol-3-phosphate acyltransferase n=1 Tax=Dichotomicrobium thermohalophilum TaxID=933063 RepID=A0A397PGB4_9HYPH|nr:lysophospholipid acyltransferase family protein [Dichotomicrobium thermohalophilum]RIA47503.1 1-acyl-sn-glycerol-3-phosphate acyltransferase [Dichotomicrobium thermohalophilum]
MLRSIAFHAAFYLTTILFMLFGLPLFFAPRSWVLWAWKLHTRTIILLLRWIGRVDMEVRGLERLPEGGYIVASKHQSAWDTIAPMAYLPDPAVILKKELMDIPLYGQFARKLGMIPVRRDHGAVALREMARIARTRAKEGRQVFIFPEGTRRAPGAPPDYKPGVVLLYEELDAPCVPLALNSGLYWPRHAWRLNPGTIIMEFLEPIPPGLPREEFRRRLIEATERGTARLVSEGQVQSRLQRNAA